MTATGKNAFDQTPDRTRLIAQFERRFSARAIRQRRRRRWKGNLWLFWIQILAGAKRAIDLGVSGGIILILSPVLGALYLRLKWNGGTVVRLPRLGRWGRVFHEHAFSSGPWKRLPALMDVLTGDMSFIGPRAAAPEEMSMADRRAWKRVNVRPGLICLWWIRSRVNIAYGTEGGADSEYVDTQTFRGDLGIALRAIPASLYGEGVTLAPDRIDLLGIPIENLTMDDAVDTIIQKAAGSTPTQVCFVNADCVNIACRDPKYKAILRECGLVLADGIGIKIAGKILNRNIRQNVNGTDLLPALCQALEKEPLSVYLLGGRPGVAADVAGWMKDKYPALQIRGHRHGFFGTEELLEVTAEIRASRAEILLVAFGVPRQEMWLREHLGETGAMLGRGVGGLFDFYSGRIPRAPVWMRESGVEWLYRFWQEPRRMWRRYFVGNFVFLARVIRDRVRTGEPV
jgi:N-acetylglucosaminyldiphosphoundecaprenol N-acetyl-beta-D-mannosaminyltransferase